jgi:hypothetical protein
VTVSWGRYSRPPPDEALEVVLPADPGPRAKYEAKGFVYLDVAAIPGHTGVEGEP